MKLGGAPAPLCCCCACWPFLASSRSLAAWLPPLLQGKGVAEPGMPVTDEHVLLDDNRYVADVVYDFKVIRACRAGGSV